MKAILFKNPKTVESSFLIQEDRLKYFYDTLHYHPEIQITLILESSGTRFIGENIGSFDAGDVYILGANLPHVFKNDRKYYDEDSHLQAKAISVYFRQDAFGDAFFHLPEMVEIRKLLDNASRGLKVSGKTQMELAAKIKTMPLLKGYECFMQLLSILQTLSQSHETAFISSINFSAENAHTDNQKISEVFDYVVKNFAENITLQEVAEKAHMSTTGFCRYFKQRTRKTFSHFLNEVRIGQACRLLVNSHYNISEIAYQCGFNNIGYFNRKFRSIHKMTPSEYVNRTKKME